MATVESNYSEIQTLKAQIALLLSNSKLPNELTKTEKELFVDNLYPRILNNGVKYRTDKGDNTDYTAFEIGDVIIHVDQVNKVNYTGTVLNATLTLPADFNDPAKIDRYSNDEPAL